MTQAIERNESEAKAAGTPLAGTARSANGQLDGSLPERLLRSLPSPVLALLEATEPPRADSSAAPARLQTLLDDLLAGQRQLPPVPPSSRVVSLIDSQLDSEQCEAVERALHSPDVCLIQGLPGSGKTRVVTEIVLQAARRNERVLLSCRFGSAVDRVLRQVAEQEFVRPLRYLGTGEDERELPDQVRQLTPAYQERRLREQSVSCVARAVAEAECRLQNAMSDLQLLLALREAATAWQAAGERHRALQEKAHALAEQVRVEAEKASADSTGEFVHHVLGERSRHADACRTLERQRQEAEKSLKHAQAEHGRRRQRVERQRTALAARRQGRWFTPGWWRALLQGRRAPERLAELERLEEEAGQQLVAAEDAVHRLKIQLSQEQDYYARAWTHLLEGEAGRRRELVEPELLQATRALDEHAAAWRHARGRLSRPARLSDMPSAESVVEQLQTLDEERRAAAEDLAQARRLQEALPGLLTDLAVRLPQCFNLVAGPVLALCAADARALAADWVIVDDAHLLGQAELRWLAGFGRRCVLAGRTVLTGETVQTIHQLWDVLHCDARRLPYRWEQRGDSLVCRLCPVPADAEARLEVEHLLDRPDVQLRILTQPGGRPVLAEVAFPLGQFGIEQAKTFLYQNLQELPLRPRAATLRWLEQDECVLADFAGVASGEREINVPLEDGVCEVVQIAEINGRKPAAVAQWATARLRFDRRLGWDRARAEQWLHDRTGLRDSGRTCPLTGHWRSTEELAGFWHACLAVELSPRRPARDLPVLPGPVVVFVPVQATPDHAAPARNSSFGRARPHGLEIDLSNPRQRQELTGELRNKLPVHGFVNLHEARAAILALELLAAELNPSLAEAGARSSEMMVAGVVSWQASQVELLRLLWEQRREPTTRALDKRIGFWTAAQLREREPLVLLVSLCRSHAQRALPYAHEAAEWVNLLTAARGRLVFFGDPEMLERRARCFDCLGKQDIATARLEPSLAGHILKLPRLGRPANRPPD